MCGVAGKRMRPLALPQLIEGTSKKAGWPVDCSLWHLDTSVWALENLRYMGAWRGIPQICSSASQSEKGGFCLGQAWAAVGSHLGGVIWVSAVLLLPGCLGC